MYWLWRPNAHTSVVLVGAYVNAELQQTVHACVENKTKCKAYLVFLSTKNLYSQTCTRAEVPSPLGDDSSTPSRSGINYWIRLHGRQNSSMTTNRWLTITNIWTKVQERNSSWWNEWSSFHLDAQYLVSNIKTLGLSAGNRKISVIFDVTDEK
jgi:hypothetical protein